MYFIIKQYIYNYFLLLKMRDAIIKMENNKNFINFFKECEDISYSSTLELYDIIMEQVKYILPKNQKHLIDNLNNCHQKIIEKREKKMYEKGFKDGSEVTAKKIKKW